MTEIYLGNPPEHIKRWIETHTKTPTVGGVWFNPKLGIMLTGGIKTSDDSEPLVWSGTDANNNSAYITIAYPEYALKHSTSEMLLVTDAGGAPIYYRQELHPDYYMFKTVASEGGTYNWYSTAEEAIASTQEIYMPLCFTCESDTGSVALTNYDGDPINDLTYNHIFLAISYDCITWNDFNGSGWDGSAISLSKGQKLYIRAMEYGNDDGMSGGGQEYNTFKLTGSIAASGNIQYLINGQCMYNYPNTTFQVPELGFLSLFSEQTSLTRMPLLPATVLANQCYMDMFYGCTNLTGVVPELPATALYDYCYFEMFKDCTSLTQAPALPATSLANQCYGCMFSGCTKLSSIDVNFSEWNPTDATTEWVIDAGTEATGTKTFTCPSTLPQTIGDDNIPSGWTIVTK